VNARFDAAAPFLASALLIAIGPFVGLPIEWRIKRQLSEWARTSGTNEDDLPEAFAPENLAAATGWVVDASQIVAVCLGPLVGVLLLHSTANGSVVLLYLAGVLVAFAWFLAFTFRSSIDRYPNRKHWWMTRVTLVGIAVNVAAAGVAAALA
jgi:hypothetical protein